MKNKKIIITGGTGFIGQALTAWFGNDNEVVILGRQSADNHKNSYSQRLLTAEEGYRVKYVKWNGKDLEENWAGEIDGADIVINLAGKSVNCRYHARQKKEITDSRVNATRVVGRAIRAAKKPPAVWINGASTTIYRHATDIPNDEFSGVISERKRDNMPYNFIDGLRYFKNRLLYSKNSQAYKELDIDFSVLVCRKWEAAFAEEQTPGTCKVTLRTAIVLGRGGVITPYLNLCKFGLGGKHGNGRQLFSWVHIEDLARMIDWLYENKKEGVYNCAAPNSITNYSLMKTMRQMTGNRLGMPAPAWLLEIGAFLIGTETELMLKSRWAIPAKALKEGFVFNYPLLNEALTEIVSGLPRKDYHLF
jgi:uncharacterized protein